jgi:hypothetical protein
VVSDAKPQLPRKSGDQPSKKRVSVEADLSDQDEIMITQEDQRMIKEVASDINEKAFYGKILKKQKEVVVDQDLMKLSPRSREIATVMRFI